MRALQSPLAGRRQPPANLHFLLLLTPPQDACPDALAVLVGNKADLEDARRVPKADGIKFAEQRSLPFFEVSAKTGERVEDVFLFISRALLERKKALAARKA